MPHVVSTPYVNTIPAEKQAAYPGDWQIERRIKSLIRWNAMAMVVNANRAPRRPRRPHLHLRLLRHAVRSRLQPFLPRRGTAISRGHGVFPGPRLAGHLRARVSGRPAGRTSPAAFPPGTRRRRRALLVSASVFDAGFLAVPDGVDGAGPDHVHLPGALQPLPAGARVHPGRGTEGLVLSSATARRTSRKRSARSRWLARENLDNLIWVVNCNLQRLDGPVRGNGKIIQELEALFNGAGWNVIKVIWGSDWDELLARGQDRSAGQAHGGSGGRRLPEIFRRAGQLHPPTFLRQVPRTCSNW